MRVLIAGCGYVGTALGRLLRVQGHHVAGLRRSAEGLRELERLGLEPVCADLARPDSLLNVSRDWDWVVQCTAPSRPEVDTYTTAYLESARNLVGWLGVGRIRAFVFTSSTSVYAQDDGSVIDEAAPAQPSSPTARVLVAAEGVLKDAARHGFPARILRVSGIYGPGRNRVGALRRGEPVSGDRGHYVNMVHRDDVVTAILGALDAGTDGATYNVSDGTPVPRGEFLGWLANRLQVPLPEPPPSEGGRASGNRLGGHKRISSEKLRGEVGWTPRYPSYREGYEAILASEAAESE